VIFVPGFAVVWLTESTGTLHDAVGFGTAGAAADADVTPTRQTTADAPAIATARNRRDEIMVNRLLVKAVATHSPRNRNLQDESEDVIVPRAIIRPEFSIAKW